MAAPQQQNHQHQSRIDKVSVRLLDVMDSFFCALLGIAFLAAAAITLVYSVINAANAMIELGIDAFVILALGVTLRIMGPYATGDGHTSDNNAI